MDRVRVQKLQSRTESPDGLGYDEVWVDDRPIWAEIRETRGQAGSRLNQEQLSVVSFSVLVRGYSRRLAVGQHRLLWRGRTLRPTTEPVLGDDKRHWTFEAEEVF